MSRYDNLKAAVAQFQMETQSNSVLDFVTWAENQEELQLKIRTEHKKYRRTDDE